MGGTQYVGAVRKPLSVSLYEPEVDQRKVCNTLARESGAKEMRKSCERDLLSELYCMLR